MRPVEVEHRRERCPDCGGRGFETGVLASGYVTVESCRACGGTGTKTREPEPAQKEMF